MRAKIGVSLLKTLKPAQKSYDVWDEELAGFVVRVQPSGVISFLVNYRRPDGRKANYTLGKHPALTAAQARDLAFQKMAEIRQGKDPQEEKWKKKGQFLGAFLKNEYTPWILQNNKTGMGAINRINLHFKDFLGKPIESINTWNIEKWRTERKASGIQATTINRDINCLRAALSKAVDWNIVDTHPLSKLKQLSTGDTGVVRYLTADEDARLRAALDARETKTREQRASANQWRQIRGYEELHSLNDQYFVDSLKPRVLISLNTGVRRGELCHLQWEDYHRTTNSLMVLGSYSKNGRTRDVPLCKEATQVLDIWWRQSGRPSSGLIFPGRFGQPLSEVKTAWRNLLAAAGIQTFRWHDLRHTFASNLAMAGVELNTIRELLGHRSLNMTLKYAHLCPGTKKAAVLKLDSIHERNGLL